MLQFLFAISLVGLVAAAVLFLFHLFCCPCRAACECFLAPAGGALPSMAQLFPDLLLSSILLAGSVEIGRPPQSSFDLASLEGTLSESILFSDADVIEVDGAAADYGDTTVATLAQVCLMGVFGTPPPPRC